MSPLANGEATWITLLTFAPRMAVDCWGLGFLIGALAGTLSGLAGVGGGIVMIPLLSYGLGYLHHTAQGTALFVFSMPILTGSAYTYYRNRRTDIFLALFIAIGVLLSGYLVAEQVQRLRSETLARIFSGFLVVIGIYLIIRENTLRSGAHASPDSFSRTQKGFRGLLIGMMSGVLSGLTGIGGGVIIVPLIRFFLRYDQHIAQGTSLATLSLPVLFAAMLPYYHKGHVNLQMGLALASGMLVASILSARWAQRLRSRALGVFFGGLVMAIGALGLFRKTSSEQVKSEQVLCAEYKGR